MGDAINETNQIKGVPLSCLETASFGHLKVLQITSPVGGTDIKLVISSPKKSKPVKHTLLCCEQILGRKFLIRAVNGLSCRPRSLSLSGLLRRAIPPGEVPDHLSSSVYRCLVGSWEFLTLDGQSGMVWRLRTDCVCSGFLCAV